MDVIEKIKMFTNESIPDTPIDPRNRQEEEKIRTAIHQITQMNNKIVLAELINNVLTMVPNVSRENIMKVFNKLAIDGFYFEKVADGIYKKRYQ